MGTVELNHSGRWQLAAVFEVEGDAGEKVRSLLSGLMPEPDLRVARAARSPDGLAWYEASIDFAHGDRRAMLIASWLIGAFETAALPGYRLVSGREWLDLAALQAASLESILEGN